MGNLRQFRKAVTGVVRQITSFEEASGLTCTSFGIDLNNRSRSMCKSFSLEYLNNNGEEFYCGASKLRPRLSIKSKRELELLAERIRDIERVFDEHLRTVCVSCRYKNGKVRDVEIWDYYDIQIWSGYHEDAS